MIKIIDNFLSQEEYNLVIRKCFESKYSFGEVDKAGFLPTGVVSNIEKDDYIHNMFSSKLKDQFEEINCLTLNRMYINLFSPLEKPFFHTDGKNGITFLFYPNIEWNIDEGGETQFLINDEIKGILPIPNRLVMFSANILHKATSFRTFHRFTLAAKYS
jgi:Rps23 Pro-64 3,4-dihydroxylase Tpa1-like proline 4-hydroxylase